jgi:hypothetical protein
MTPEPSPALWFELASTDTTDGSTLAATSWTEPAGAGVKFCETDVPVFNRDNELSEAEDWLLSQADPAQPPAKPATSASAVVVATTREVVRPRGFDEVVEPVPAAGPVG